MKFTHTLAASVAAALMATSALAMTQQEHKAGLDQATAQYKADKKSCDALKDNAKDVCMKEAKGKEDIAKAELDAQYKPSAKATHKVADTRADAAYEVA